MGCRVSDDLDFRVRCGLFDHPKWMRLDAALGDKGTMALMRLWGWARRHRDDGSLHGLSDAEIARAARWRGPAAKLVSALADLGWLDGAVGARALHDWLDHQPHSANTKGFQRAQRMKIIKRWAETAGMTPEQYSRYSFGMDLEDYLSRGKSHTPVSRGSIPGDTAGIGAFVPPPSHPPSTPTTPAPEARAPDPDRGFASTPSSPQVEHPPTGRSLRLPQPASSPADNPQEAQAAAAHRLELAIGCTFKQALKSVQSLVVAGADIVWIEARIARSTGTTQTPWAWVASSKQAWADHQERVGAGA